jgi:CHASE2 domain-containing sensor protein
MPSAVLQPPRGGLWLGLAGGLVAWLLALTSPLRGLDDWLLDGCFCLRGNRPTEARVVLIGLDESFPDGRDKKLPQLSPELAAVVRHVKAQGAAAIGLDLYVPQSLSTHSDIEPEGSKGDPRPLGDAILEAGNVVLPVWKVEGRWEKPLLQWQRKSFLQPEPTDFGFVNLTEDADLVVRRQQLLVRAGDEAIPQFALALLARGRGAEIAWDDRRQSLQVERVGRERIRLDPDQTLRINYAGPPGRFPLLSFGDVWEAARKKRPQPEFAGAIVIIGLTGKSQPDCHATPYSNPLFARFAGDGPRLMTGMELHAHVLATLADRAAITTTPWYVLLPLLLASGALLGLACSRWPRRAAVPLALLHPVAWLVAAYAVFAHADCRLPIVPALLLSLFVPPLAVRLRRPTGTASTPPRQPPESPLGEDLFAQERGSRAEDQTFSSQSVLLRYPAPVAVAYRRFLRQHEPRARLDMLFFAAEALLRYLATLGLADLFHCLAESGRPDAGLPAHKAFDCQRQPRTMQLGMWAELLRETARALAGQKGRLVRELPEVCRPGGRLDADLVAALIHKRNDCCHPGGSIALTAEECPDAVRAARPLLEQALQEARFLCRYPLGFAEPGVGAATEPGQRRYALHSCMGAQVADPAPPHALEAPLRIEEGLPFVAVPDGSRLVYLWPLLFQAVSPLTGRHTLYVFEQIEDGRRPFLGAVRVASIEVRETRVEVLREEPAASHAWLLQRLRDLPSAPAVPPDLRLPERLLPWRGGRLVGQKLGDNRLLAVVAGGGFGTVYAAVTGAGERVAVKVIEGPTSPDQFRRFTREFDKLRQAGQHPGIIRCRESGVAVVAGREYPWYSMEFAEGGDLAGRLEERRLAAGAGIPWDEPSLRVQVVAEFTAVAGAVAHLHRLGIVHRDVKPGNVLITAGGELRLSDFGLVKTLQPSEASLLQGPRDSTGAVLGTPRYMAPEQARAGDVGTAADVYALGILLAELALGTCPEPELAGAAGSTLAGRTPLGRLPPGLRKFLLRCTARAPEGRPADAGAVQEEFAGLLAALLPPGPDLASGGRKYPREVVPGD